MNASETPSEQTGDDEPNGLTGSEGNEEPAVPGDEPTAEPTTELTTDAAAAAVGDDGEESSEAPATDECATGSDIRDAACDIGHLEELGLPLGWAPAQRWDPKEDGWAWASHLLGWLLTALLIMLGGPFWFDLLRRLVSVRSSRYSTAADDPGSNTSLLMAAPAGPPATPPGSGPAERMLMGKLAFVTDTRDLTRSESIDWLALALNRTNPIPRPDDKTLSTSLNGEEDQRPVDEAIAEHIVNIVGFQAAIAEASSQLDASHESGSEVESEETTVVPETSEEEPGRTGPPTETPPKDKTDDSTKEEE